MGMKKIYVETRIAASMEEVWAASQQPESHQRWDLRFQRIKYLPKTRADEAQRFCYSTAGIDGVGISIGERRRPDGSATSALRFSSTHPLSAITQGSGYWRYVPAPEGMRFLTGYDYVPRWRGVDVVFRPLMGWATAWSFDRLRLWLERDISPESAFRRAATEVAVRAVLVCGLFLVHPAAILLGLLMAVLVPPLPGTPAARRCLRKAPNRESATAPGGLAALVQP